MKKYFIIIVLTIFLVSCENKSDLDISIYQNAKNHLSQNLNKYLKNTVTSQIWNDDELIYKVKNDTIIKTYKIDLETLDLRETDENYLEEEERDWLKNATSEI